MARGWSGVLGSWPADDALLLVEYPGFGACAGTPSPAHIQAATMAAIHATADRLGVTSEVLCKDSGVLGHSLGCATALQCADALPGCRHIALFAPFTSLSAMARRHVGWPLYLVLSKDQNYDNAARLRSLGSRPHPPMVAIATGDQDEVIPYTMGQELATIIPGTRFWLLPGANHLGALQAIDLALPTIGR